MSMKNAMGGLSVLGAIAVTFLTGCANGIPKGKLSYFLPKAETTLTVTQTLTCNATGDALLQVVSVNPSTIYSGDTSRSMTVTPSSISSSISDADISFSFTDDGRLSGANTATTGQGGVIVKNVVAVAKVAGLVPARAPEATNAKAACTAIGVLTPKAKTDGPPPSVTITYVLSFGFDTSSGTVQLKDGDKVGLTFESEFGTTYTSNTYFRTLKSSIPKLGFDVVLVNSTKRAAPNWTDGDSTDLVLPLNALATVNLNRPGFHGGPLS